MEVMQGFTTKGLGRQSRKQKFGLSRAKLAKTAKERVQLPNLASLARLAREIFGDLPKPLKF
jgi:hypothetical protein